MDGAHDHEDGCRSDVDSRDADAFRHAFIDVMSPARVLDDDSRPNYLHGERNSAEIFRKCVGVRVVRPTGEKKKAGSKAMEPAR